MRVLLVGLLLVTWVWGMKVHHKQWKKGQTFSDYLSARQIPRSVLDIISKEDQKFLSEIRSGYSYYEMLDNEGNVDQALIPISQEMQIHLFRKQGSEDYRFDIIPIHYTDKEYFGKVTIASSPCKEMLETVKNEKVSERLSMALKGVIDTDKLHKGDEIDFVYSQRTRLGQVYTSPQIKIVKVRMGSNEKFIYVDEDGLGYDAANKKVTYTITGKKKVVYTRRVNPQGKVFGMPLRHIRITSNFSYHRWHPILHRYRPHHGTDFGARRGTPLLAVNDGRVSYAGWMRGYGKVVKIRHAGGYESLYAHQSRIRVNLGQRVKKGDIIGYVGSTGRSTGPHLHFGLMKNGRWIDPMKVLKKKSVGSGQKITKYKKVEIKHVQERKQQLEAYLKNNIPSYIWGKEYFQARLQDEELLEDAVQ